MDEETRRFVQAILTCLALSTGLGIAIVAALAWWVA